MSKNHNWLDRTLVIAPLHYTIASNMEILEEICNHLNVSTNDFKSVKTDAARTTFFTSDSGEIKVSAVVYLPYKPDKSKFAHYGLIVHEAVHIWQEIKELLGENNPSKEFEAYSLQWISQELMSEYDAQVNGVYNG